MTGPRLTQGGRDLRWVAGLALLALLVTACTHSSTGDGVGTASAQPSAPAPGVVSPASASPTPGAPLPSAATGPVLTPEDAEDDAEHRITDQNLESELDRLEREIQAE